MLPDCRASFSGLGIAYTLRACAVSFHTHRTQKESLVLKLFSIWNSAVLGIIGGRCREF